MTASVSGSRTWTRSWSIAVPVLVVTIPARWPRVGALFHGMSGTVAPVANTGGSTLSYSDGCVSARVSSARLASPKRKPYGSGGLHEELVRQSGVRYEYPTQPIPLFPAALGASALRTWTTDPSTELR